MLDQQYEVYHEALQAMAGRDEDYGTQRNEVGFSRFDGPIGHALARLPFEQWSAGQLVAAHRVLQRYKNTQLPALGYTWEDMPTVDTDHVPVRDAGTDRPGYAHVAVEGNTFVFEWGGADPYFRNRIGDIKELIAGARWDKQNKRWHAPLTIVNVDAVGTLLAKYAGTDLPFAEDDSFRPGLHAYIDNVEAMLQASAARETSDDSVALHRLVDPEKARPFQKAGIAFATAAERTIIADDMGLGKTMQSIAAVCEADAFPALVVCPASLKLNWKREIEMWVATARNGRPRVQVCEGTKNPVVDTAADFVVINYDIMKAWKDELAEVPWAAIVCDEAHAMKNDKSLRTKAVKHVIKKAAPTMRLLLTGTPILNRPIELWPLLGLLGAQDTFGGFWGFVNRYCAPKNNGFGYDFTGASNLQELNSQLRAAGLMIRRRKEDVLDELPDKQWATVPVAMTPAHMAKAYADAERDLAAFLAKYGDNMDSELRAEALQRVSTLRKLAYAGKEKAVYEWIDEFVATGKKLIVFAHHRSAVEGIAERYGAPRIMGGMDKAEIERGKDAFQNNPDVRVIVCNLAAGGVGHTLTAASDVLFVEQAWNDALMDQAISRAHRIGQRSSVTGWVMLAQQPGGAETIDHEMAEMIAHKGAITAAAVDGKAVGDAQPINVRAQLLAQLAAMETEV